MRVTITIFLVSIQLISFAQNEKTIEYADSKNSFSVLIPKDWKIENPISNKQIVLKTIDRNNNQNTRMFNIQINSVPNAASRIDLSKITNKTKGYKSVIDKGVKKKGQMTIHWIESIDNLENHSLMYMIPRGDELFTLHFYVSNEEWGAYKILANKCMDSFSFTNRN